jgi:hypothetical protein
LYTKKQLKIHDIKAESIDLFFFTFSIYYNHSRIFKTEYIEVLCPIINLCKMHNKRAIINQLDCLRSNSLERNQSNKIINQSVERNKLRGPSSPSQTETAGLT